MSLRDLFNVFGEAEDTTEQDSLRREGAQQELELRKEQMLSKECPISGSTCRTSCVHFQSGFVRSFEPFMDGQTYYGIKEPSCKLWRT